MILAATFSTPERVVRYCIGRVNDDDDMRVDHALDGNVRVVGRKQDVMLLIGEIAEQGEDGLLTVVQA